MGATTRRHTCLCIPMLLALASTVAQAESSTATLAQGEYLFRAAGCLGCHTDEKNSGRRLAGGRAIGTGFGIFHTPNITPDPATGIGKWQREDFFRAMRQGIAPDGRKYYPAFPYSSYTRLSDEDLIVLWAFLKTLPPVKRANKAHELRWFTPPRWLVGVWQWLFLDVGGFSPDKRRPDDWNRGAYLVQAAGHCGECHTPRNVLGAPRSRLAYAGRTDDAEGTIVPNITPDEKTGIGDWSRDDIVTYLETGMRPDGDTAEGLMAEVIDNSLQHLRSEDLAAIAVYLQALPAISHFVARNDNDAKEETP